MANKKRGKAKKKVRGKKARSPSGKSKISKVKKMIKLAISGKKKKKRR